MFVIGERINSTRPAVQEAIKGRNSVLIIKEARSQLASGASYIDINCAVTAGDELQDVDWVISVLQSEIPGVSICIDSPNYLAVEKALNVYKAGGGIFINSITAEDARIRQILPLAMKHKAKLIALTLDENGMPNTAEERFEIARRIYDRVRRSGFPAEDLYFDALIRPVATEPLQGQEFLKAIPMIKKLGDVKTICGLSNISFGLPRRNVINATFLAMAAQAGLDAAILDPTDAMVATSIAAVRAILCQDGYCAEYIKAFREGRLVSA
jgi:5-methyltetrahydrofolate--homocysteine methyltransferase